MAKLNVSPIPRERYPALPRLKISRAGKICDSGATYGTSVDAVLHTKKMRRLDREEFWTIHLDTKNRMIGYEVISVGSLSASIVHPREVFKGLLLNNASAMICLHNHPSGDPTPSGEDIEITKRLKEGADLLGIRLLDHIIIGSEDFCSLADRGLI